MDQEFFTLAVERLSRIASEDAAGEPYQDYFRDTAAFLLRLCDLAGKIGGGSYFLQKQEVLSAENSGLYEELFPEHYGESYANPVYATQRLGSYGGFLSALKRELRSCIPDVFEQKTDRLLSWMQYFLGVYSSFVSSAQDNTRPDKKELLFSFTDFILYRYEKETEERVLSGIDPDLDFAFRIITGSDLSDLRYLYRYGEYISEDQIKTAEHLLSLPEKKLQLMADTFTEGYRIGFEKTGKDLSKKGTVQILYPIGFEPVVKLAIANFKAMGLRPVIRRDAASVTEKRYGGLKGYYGGEANRQYDYDHREDAALFLCKKVCDKRLSATKKAYEKHKALAAQMAGPAVIEVFGQTPFTPAQHRQCASYNSRQRSLIASYYGAQSELVNRYIKGEERSFTIIAFPLPQIGEQYPQIMEETIRLNTLDWRIYEKLQQKIIDVLDTCESVELTGQSGNETALTVALCELKDPKTATKFENCVADVNIPVGEVFTSPRLTGTNGLLHVKKVYLNGLSYQDLKIRLSDGRVTEYGCANFPDPDAGKRLVESQILHHHKRIAVGEFAIGTNTTAYRMGRRFGIEDRLPILIAEKTGPHLALGDTCYSHEEDVRAFNPDGKEIVARDNEVSLHRKSKDPALREKAYFACHTDITIPYDELGSLCGIRADGERIAIIENGRFVLPGTEQLNKALEEA